MPDNQNVSLRDLIANSFSYQSLPPESQKIFMDRILALPEEGQKEVIDILIHERNEKARIDEEAATKLQNVADTYLPKLKQLEEKFEKSVTQELEKKSKEGEEEEMDKLLGELDEE